MLLNCRIKMVLIFQNYLGVGGEAELIDRLIPARCHKSMQFLIMPSLIFQLKKPQPRKTAASSNFNLGTETDVIGDRGEPLSTFMQPYI